MNASAIGIEVGPAAGRVVDPGPVSDLLPVSPHEQPAYMVLVDDVDLIASKAKRIVAFHVEYLLSSLEKGTHTLPHGRFVSLD